MHKSRIKLVQDKLIGGGGLLASPSRPCDQGSVLVKPIGWVQVVTSGKERGTAIFWSNLEMYN
jgi:hypothetical protein